MDCEDCDEPIDNCRCDQLSLEDDIPEWDKRGFDSSIEYNRFIIG